MLYWFLFLLFLILSLLFIRVNYIIEFDKELTVKIKIAFFEKTLFSSSRIEKIDPVSIIKNISYTKELVLDLYKKFKGTLKVKKIDLSARLGTGEPNITALAYGLTHSLFSVIIAFFDNIFSLKKKQVSTHVVASFLEDSSFFKLKFTLYTSLFSFVLFSTYAFIKNGILGGKNGRKQAKRNDKNST